MSPLGGWEGAAKPGEPALFLVGSEVSSGATTRATWTRQLCNAGSAPARCRGGSFPQARNGISRPQAVFEETPQLEVQFTLLKTTGKHACLFPIFSLAQPEVYGVGGGDCRVCYLEEEIA